MKTRCCALVAAALISAIGLACLLLAVERTSPNALGSVSAASASAAAPIVAGIDPSHAPNDLDSPVVITGVGFTAEISGTQVLTPPRVFLGTTALQAVTWVNSATLSATVSWGLEPGIYTLTVQDLNGETGTLPNAFTVTQGIGVWTAGELYGGEFIQVAFHPTNPDILYAQASGAGLFRSRDHGATWSLAYNDAQADLAVSPAAPDRIYVQAYCCLQRSDDQGDTWTTLQPPHFDDNTSYTPLPHPTEPNTVYVAATSHIVDNQRGVYKSTDAGQTWITLTAGLTDTRVTALAFHPTNPLTMYAGTANGHVFTSGDGGQHWAWASRPVESIRTLVVEPWDDHSVWVDCPGGYLANPCDMKRSLNPELTEWETISPSHPVAGFAGNVSFSPAQTGTIYIGIAGWRSFDDGQTWSELPVEGMFPIWFAFDPSDADTIFASSLLRGMYKTSDGGDTWELTNQGLAAMKPVQLAIPPGHPEEVYATFDRWVELFKGSRGGSVWQPIPNANTSGLFLIDPSDPQRIYRSRHTEMCVSQDGGLTWPICSPMQRPDWCQDCISAPDDFEANPHQVGELIAGMSFVHMQSPLWPWRGELYRSLDAGLTWELITSAQPISRVVNIVYDPDTPGVIFVSTAGGGILRSLDNGQTWQSISAGQSGLEYTNLLVEPVYPYRLLAPGGYIGLEHGSTWQTFQPAGFLGITRQYLFTPEEQPVLYAASVFGLVRSFDFGHNWSRVPGVLGYANIVSLDAQAAEGRVILYVGTTGGAVMGAPSLESAGGSQMVAAGVYRYTTRVHKLFLPMVKR